MGTVNFAPVQAVRNLKDGKWWDCDTENWTKFTTLRQASDCPDTLVQFDEVDKVVQSAKAALHDWSETPVVERARMMFRLRNAD